MATSRLSTRRVEWRVQVGTTNKAAQGLVIFEASVSYIPDPLAAGGPRTAIPEPVAAVLDGSGFACTPDASNPAKASERGVDLFTTDSLGEDGGDWTWTARPQLRSVNGIQMSEAVPAFSFFVPTGTDSLDLAKVQKVPASPGLGTEAAVALVARAERAVEDMKGSVQDTVGTAAAAAVGEEIIRADLLRSITASTEDDDAAGGTLDSNNRVTWLTHDESGGPTSYALKRLGIAKTEGLAASGGFRDANDRLTWLTHNESGGPTEYAVKRIREALALDSDSDPNDPETPLIAQGPSGNRHAMLENELRLRYGGTIRTNGAAPVVMIFDHGLNNFRDIVLPMLTARGFPSVMALNGNMHKPGYNIEAESKDVTWAEIDAWASVEVANHGASHTTVAVSEAGLANDIVQSLADLRANLPNKAILTWVEPAINYPGFNDGLTTSNWTDTTAGRLIHEHHAVATGTMKAPTHPLIPRDGNILQGMVGVWIDAKNSTTTIKQQIQSAAASGKGIIIRHHPRTINATDSNITTAELMSFFDFLKAEQDAKRIQVLNLSQWSIADTGK